MTMKMKRNVCKKAYLHALANVRFVMTATITGDRIKRKNSSYTTGIKRQRISAQYSCKKRRADQNELKDFDVDDWR